MKITIVGAGAIGGLLAARLAIAGEAVTVIARNRNLAAINAQGLRLLLPDGSSQHASALTVGEGTQGCTAMLACEGKTCG